MPDAQTHEKLIRLEAEVRRLNAILDDIEAMASDDSLDARLIAAIVKNRRKA
jgi:hypothetical protein